MYFLRHHFLLHFYEKQEFVRFLKFFPHPAPARKFKQGDLIVFPSLYPHKVSHVRSGTRYSLVIWGGGLHPEKYFRMKKQQELNRQAKKDGSWGVASEP